jgi:hypothetical protein
MKSATRVPKKNQCFCKRGFILLVLNLSFPFANFTIQEKRKKFWKADILVDDVIERLGKAKTRKETESRKRKEKGRTGLATSNNLTDGRFKSFVENTPAISAVY